MRVALHRLRNAAHAARAELAVGELRETPAAATTTTNGEGPHGGHLRLHEGGHRCTCGGVGVGRPSIVHVGEDEAALVGRRRKGVGERAAGLPDAAARLGGSAVVAHDERRVVLQAPALGEREHLHLRHLIRPGRRQQKVVHAALEERRGGEVVDQVGAGHQAEGDVEARREARDRAIGGHTHVGLAPQVLLVVLGEVGAVRVERDIGVVHIAGGITHVHQVGHDRHAVHLGSAGERDEGGRGAEGGRRVARHDA